MLLRPILEKDRKDKSLDIFASNTLYDAPLKTLEFCLARNKMNLRHILINVLFRSRHIHRHLQTHVRTHSQMHTYHTGLMIYMHDNTR